MCVEGERRRQKNKIYLSLDTSAMRQKYIRRCDVEAQKEFSLQALVSFEMILIAILSTRGINFRIDQRLKFISRRSHDKAACQGEPNKNSFNLLSMAVFFLYLNLSYSRLRPHVLLHSQITGSPFIRAQTTRYARAKEEE
jgi:hypothetical protein